MSSETEGAWIIVTRPDIINRRDVWRTYDMRLDDVPIGKLYAGGQICVRISPGKHRIRARIDWTGSKELVFHAEGGATYSYEVRPQRNALLGIFQILGRTTYLILTPTPSHPDGSTS
jgi:hypothetical protein